MDTFIKSLEMKNIADMMATPDQFVELYNAEDAVLLDIRYAFETELWVFNFSQAIPLNELPERLFELPKDKTIVCACPQDVRSNIACQFLLTKGYKAKFLAGGFIALADRLRGGKAKDLKARG